MSLELEIKNLTEAVKELTKQLAAANLRVVGQEGGDTPTLEPEPVKAEPVKTESVKVEPVKEPVKTKPKKPVEVNPVEDTISEQDLQGLCMKIVQADRSKGQTIKAMLAEYDGAKTIKQVSPDNYQVLKEALEGLLHE